MFTDMYMLHCKVHIITLRWFRTQQLFYFILQLTCITITKGNITIDFCGVFDNAQFFFSCSEKKNKS